MTEKTSVLFPGQGSQYVGMGEDLYNAYAEVRELFEQASDLLKIDMKELCFKGPEEVLKQTENAQPAVTLVNAACYAVLKKEGYAPAATAGHSLGEYSALYAAGVFDFASLMRTVRQRGIFMQEAADKNPGGMLAVMGLPMEKVTEVCASLKESTPVEIANYNSPRQVILTGEAEAIENAAALAKKAKGLVIKLKVSGPWHSRFMAGARAAMEEFLGGVTVEKASIPVVSNVSADYMTEPDEIKRNLVDQITCPVRWTDSIARLLSDGNRSFVEAGPGKVLKGLMREINKEVKTYNIENTATLKAFVSEGLAPGA